MTHTVRRLAAKAMIHELEAEEEVNKGKHLQHITQLGLSFSLASKYTSFVAIQTKTDATKGSLISAGVPSPEAVFQLISLC